MPINRNMMKFIIKWNSLWYINAKKKNPLNILTWNGTSDTFNKSNHKMVCYGMFRMIAFV